MSLLSTRSFFLSLFVAQSLFLTAQSTLSDWNSHRLHRTSNAMLVLGTWATANILVGAIGASQSKNPEIKAFHQMNLGWGVINLGLATSGYWTATHTNPSGLDWWGSMTEQQQTERIFLFNAGLDAGYIMAGLWLKERAKNSIRHTDRLRGFGKSILVQGAFLLVFDLGAYAYHHRLDQGLKPLLPTGTTIGFLGDGFGVRISL